ncbi:MAG: flagellar motor protein MotB [Deltaproteobacteria bacterium]|nr:flagellar motor protein MotB [Deltaproteobacteria bacterium]
MPSENKIRFEDLEKPEEAPEWLVTYADMVTLLMTFFVMLVAISSLNTAKFKDVITSIQYTMGADKAPGGRIGRIDAHDVRQQSLSQTSGDMDEPILKDIRQVIKLKNLDDAIEVERHGQKIIVRVKGQVLFGSGAEQLMGGASPVLDELAKLVKAYPDWRLDVKGHTDSVPVKSPKYASNWELSALRATAVLRALIDRGVNYRRMTATGYADTDPLVPNTTPDNMARNRRVEFVLEKKEDFD